MSTRGQRRPFLSQCSSKGITPCVYGDRGRINGLGEDELGKGGSSNDQGCKRIHLGLVKTGKTVSKTRLSALYCT